MKKVLVVALAASFVPALASAEVWTVSEGPAAKVKGTWTVTVTGAEVSGTATMGGINGQTLTYGVNGQQKDGGFVIHRIKSSDRTDCVYIGKPKDAKTIAGSAMCNGASSPWTVTRN